MDEKSAHSFQKNRSNISKDDTNLQVKFKDKLLHTSYYAGLVCFTFSHRRIAN